MLKERKRRAGHPNTEKTKILFDQLLKIKKVKGKRYLPRLSIIKYINNISHIEEIIYNEKYFDSLRAK